MQVPWLLAFPSLLLKTAYMTEIDLRRPVRDQVTISDIKVCNHSTAGEQDQMTEALQEVNFPGRASTATTYSCAACPADMHFYAEKQSGEVFATLVLRTWRDLDPRQRHSLRPWHAQTSSCPHYSFDRARNGYAFGSLWLGDVFKKAEQQECSVAGLTIEQPESGNQQCTSVRVATTRECSC